VARDCGVIRPFPEPFAPVAKVFDCEGQGKEGQQFATRSPFCDRILFPTGSAERLRFSPKHSSKIYRHRGQ
jgi:hypothetical protein